MATERKEHTHKNCQNQILSIDFYFIRSLRFNFI